MPTHASSKPTSRCRKASRWGATVLGEVIRNSSRWVPTGIRRRPSASGRTSTPSARARSTRGGKTASGVIASAGRKPATAGPFGIQIIPSGVMHAAGCRRAVQTFSGSPSA